MKPRTRPAPPPIVAQLVTGATVTVPAGADHARHLQYRMVLTRVSDPIDVHTRDGHLVIPVYGRRPYQRGVFGGRAKFSAVVRLDMITVEPPRCRDCRRPISLKPSGVWVHAVTAKRSCALDSRTVASP